MSFLKPVQGGWAHLYNFFFKRDHQDNKVTCKSILSKTSVKTEVVLIYSIMKVQCYEGYVMSMHEKQIREIRKFTKDSGG